MRFLVASVILFSSLALLPVVAQAEQKLVPCPVIQGVLTITDSTKTRCVFPNTFTLTSVGLTKHTNGQKELEAFNLNNFGPRDRVATDSGRPSGSTGATDTTNPSGSSTATPKASQSRYEACEANSKGSTSALAACVVSELWNTIPDPLSWLTLGTLWLVLSMVAYIFFMAAEFLMWMGTTLFDNVLYFFVVNMSIFIQHENAKGIRDAWIAIRDLMNIGIIAGFIIVGISTILQAQQYNANRFLARLIIAALLVNFSYFFAGAVIDASNFIATAAYKSKLMPEDCVNLTDSKNLSFSLHYSVLLFVKPTELCSVAATFKKTLNFASWNDIRKFGRDETTVGDSNRTIFFVGMIGGFFFVITGFVFFSAAILLIGRFIVLILLLITSPVGVAGINIPYLDEYAKKWWGMLFSHAFLAPVYIILVAIGLRITMDTKKIFVTEGSLNSAIYADIATGNFKEASNAVPLFISFFIGIALMYAALQIARGMSESGKEFVGAIYEGLQKRVGSIYGDFYQATAGGALRLPSAAYDATIAQLGRIPLVGPMLFSRFTTPLGKMLRQDPGGKPFGASKTNAEAAKDTQEYNKSLEMFGKPIQYALDPVRSFKKFTHAIGVPFSNMMESWRGKSVAALMKKAEKGEELTPAQRRKIERYVESLTDEERGAMTSKELAKIAPYMSAKQFKKDMDRADLNDIQRKDIMDSRWKDFNKAQKAGNHDEAARILRNMEKTERKMLVVEKKEVRTDEKILAALDAKTYEDMVNDTDLYGSDADFKLKDGTDVRDHRARQVANTPKKISETDAKRITYGSTEEDKKKGAVDITEETIDSMTPAQARRVYANTENAKLRARLAARFPDLAQPGPAGAAADADAEEARKQKEKDNEDKKKKDDDEAEEAAEKKRKEDKNKK